MLKIYLSTQKFNFSFIDKSHTNECLISNLIDDFWILQNWISQQITIKLTNIEWQRLYNLNKIQLQYIQINEMLADDLIKALNQIKFKQMIKRLYLINWLIMWKNRLNISHSFCIDFSADFSYNIQLLESIQSLESKLNKKKCWIWLFMKV
jgi:hypothetical protein